ncbi:putative amidohydrolase [Erwinia toletana]|uniref:Amidohydrolase n=1 Tax=Winslowiella toletana TaxID=92490 RepID=A0ABS4PBI7_9GAMM|nr:nitrilase-related carbon-nitrogen hydrolase [Winslowiella toletana]MBP2169537.1 putative amidohydrolase [Winslowiella toletana]
MTDTHLQVAAIQFEPTQFRKEENISQLLALADAAAQDGARLIVMPEMGTTGYCWRNRNEVAPFVETVDGATCQRFSALAREHNCYLVLGMPEVDAESGLYYNSAVLIGPQGVIGVHRKTHPYISEPKWAANGDLGHQVFATPIGNIALLICMDIHFIETARLAAVGGAQIICHISNWLAERTPAPYWLTRAWENGCALIESNRWGWERGVQFSGGSCVVDGDGQLLAARDSGDGIVAAQIQLPQHNPALAKRRPELYQRLMTNTFIWNPGDFFGLYGMEPLPRGKQSPVAVAQFTPQIGPDLNLRKMREMAQAAKRAGVELMVFPEKALTGGSGREQAMTASHPVVAQFLQLAVELDMALLTGWIEQEGDTFYNSALLVGAQGVIANYRQIHLNAADQRWATAGDSWVTADLPCGRVGLLLGEDLLIPEAGRILALEGCDLLACPAALAEPLPLAHSGTVIRHNYPIPTGVDPLHCLLPRVRAGENNLWLAFANSCDEQTGSFGISGIYGPDTFAFPRSEAKVMQTEGMVTLTIDTGDSSTPYPTHVVRRKDLVLMRQPHYYRALVTRRAT